MNPYEWLGFPEISVIYWENICDAREHTAENSWKREDKLARVQGSTLCCKWFCHFTTTKKQKARKSTVVLSLSVASWFFAAKNTWVYMHSYTLGSHSVHGFYALVHLYWIVQSNFSLIPLLTFILLCLCECSWYVSTFFRCRSSVLHLLRWVSAAEKHMEFDVE